MKKLAAAAIAVLVIGGAGWSALWFMGRGEVEARLDAEEALLAQRGYALTRSAREIGGFPFGYEVTYRDLRIALPRPGNAQPGAYVLPWLAAEVTAGDIDRITARFPEKFEIEIPFSAGERAADPGLPEKVRVEVEADGLTAVMDGVLSVARELTVTAGSVLAVSAGPGQSADIAIELIGLEAGMTLLPPGDGRTAPSRIVADRVEYAFAVAEGDATPMVLEGGLDRLRMTGASDRHGAEAAMAALFSGNGVSSVTYQTGASRGVLTLPEGAAGWTGTISFATGSSAGTMAIENGVVRLDAAGQAGRIAARVGGAEGTGPEFGIALSAVEIGYAMPMAPREEMTPVLFRLALDQVVMDEALWTLLDAGGTLPRDPATLMVDIEGSARVTKRLDEVRPGEAPPYEIGTATIRAADLNLLGASVTTRGEVEFLQPVMIPVGSVTVTLNGVFQLVNKLVEAGLLTPEMAQTAVALGMSFTEAGPNAGERVSKIAMGVDGIKVNGVAIGP